MSLLRLLLVAALGTAFALSLSASVASARTERLSDERTLSRWAHPNDRAPARRKPDGRSRTVTHLRFLTEDREPEVYLALRRTWDQSGQEWVQIRLPRRPNGSTGWVRREALGPWHRVRTRLIINRRTLRASLYKSGRRIWTSRIGVGEPRTPTPGGRFYIREKLIALEGGTIYGPLAFGTSAYSSLSDWPRGGVVGIHGTNQPELIPGRPSHGCIRVPNPNIRRLGRIMPLGTPVRIL
jgi:L,D-transpeptidase catalytic domain